MSDLFDDLCTACGERYQDHTEDGSCWAHQLARRIVARAMEKVFFPEDEPAYNPCPYTHAHTRSWCGHDGCRES